MAAVLGLVAGSYEQIIFGYRVKTAEKVRQAVYLECGINWDYYLMLFHVSIPSACEKPGNKNIVLNLNFLSSFSILDLLRDGVLVWTVDDSILIFVKRMHTK